MRLRLSAFVLLLTIALAAHADHWPGWRGPRGDGHSTEKNLPLTWDRTDHVRWKVALPSPGNSTPAVWGDRIFVTQSLDKAGTRRAVLCFARADGKLLWQKETPYPDKEVTHATNPFCAASPVTDGTRVIASLGSAGLVCYDFDGKEQWRVDLGQLRHLWGTASSPILYGELAILLAGPGDRQFLLAVHKATGKEVWKKDIPGGKFGKTAAEWLGSWATPLVVRVAGHDELIVPVPEQLMAFDPKTGDALWSCGGLGKLIYTSPVATADGVVVCLSGYHGPALAVKAGGKGDVTKTHRLWHHTKGLPQRIGAPVVVGDHFYLLNENSTAVCVEVKTGKEVWKDRLPGVSWSSMVAADGRLYVTNHDGICYVLAAAPKFELLATNALKERVLSSVAVSDGDLFIRSYEHLWCIGKGK